MAVKAVFLQSVEDFVEMFFMFWGIIGIDQDIVWVDSDSYIKEVGEYNVHESLEHRRHIIESE